MPTSYFFDHLRNHSHLTTKIEASRDKPATTSNPPSPVHVNTCKSCESCKSITWPTSSQHTQHSLEARTVEVDPVEPPRGAMIQRRFPWKVDESLGQRNEYRELCACIKFQLSPRGQTRRGWFQPSKLKVQGAASRPTTLEVTTTNYPSTRRPCSVAGARVHRWTPLPRVFLFAQSCLCNVSRHVAGTDSEKCTLQTGEVQVKHELSWDDNVNTWLSRSKNWRQLIGSVQDKFDAQDHIKYILKIRIRRVFFLFVKICLTGQIRNIGNIRLN